MPRIETMTDVTPDQLQTVVNGYKLQGATVVKKLQDDDNYTVIATFPDTGTTRTGPQTVGQ